MKQIALLVFFMITSICVNSQSFYWGKSFYSASGSTGESITSDNQGNSYIAGMFYGTVDFDPGPGLYMLTSVNTNYYNISITKLGPTGNLIWAKAIGGPAYTMDPSVAIDATGNVYVSGFFSQTVDFDPGPGTYTLTATGSTDAFILKLDPSGNFIWAERFGGSFDTRGLSVTTDATGNVYTTGYFRNTNVDFDPGPATYTLSNTGSFVLKLNPTGGFEWVRGLDSGTGQGKSICIDASGNVLTAGTFNGGIDLDPGLATNTALASGGTDVYISKLDINGDFVWGKTIGGNSNDELGGITTDGLGNVYTTGYFVGTVDFDPGPSTYTYTSYTSGGADMFISKLGINGDFAWTKRIGHSYGYDIAVDASANVYTTGYMYQDSDFDPGSGIATLSLGNNTNLYSAFISKLDASGNYVMATNIINTANQALSYGFDIALDPYGSVYTTGIFSGTVDFDPGPNTSTGSASANGNAFINKLCAFPVVTITGNTPVCSGQSATLTASGANTYLWNTGATTSSVIVSPTALTVYTVTGTNPGGCALSKTISVSVTNLPNITISGSNSVCAGQSRTLTASGASTYTWSTGATTSTTVVSPASSTVYTVSGKSSAGCANTKTVNITVSALPVISISGNTLVCQGKNTVLTGSGITSYTWNTGAHTASINPIITAPTSFSLDGKDANGCAGIQVVATISVNPAPVITASSGTICSGQSFTLNPSGALTYTYSGGSSVVNPASSSNYTISGTGNNGCTGTGVTHVTVNALPNINVLSSTPELCAGNTATLTANGAITYTWSTGSTNNNIVVSPTITTSYTVTGTNTNGCKKTTVSTQSISVCQGIEQLAASGTELYLYPNPAQHNVVIHYATKKNSTVTIIIMDAIGKEIRQLMANKAHQAGDYEYIENISELNTGLYFVKINVNQAESVVKLVKVN